MYKNILTKNTVAIAQKIVASSYKDGFKYFILHHEVAS